LLLADESSRKRDSALKSAIQLLILFCWCGTRGASAHGSEERLPDCSGTRIGPFTADTGHAGLRRVFGASNVVNQIVYAGEGMEEPGTIVFKGDQPVSYQILWRIRI